MADEHTLLPLRYRLETRVGEYEVRRADGVERIGKPFVIELWARADNSAGMLDPDDLCGDVVCLALHRDGAHVRRLRGIATYASVEATHAGEPEIHLVLEPRLARARYRRDCRVFRDLSVPNIVATVLERGDIQLERRLIGEYPKRPYVVQYNESDLDFVSRLMEEEGIGHFMLDDVAGGIVDVDEPPILVLFDHAEAYQPIAGDPQLAFVPGKGLESESDSVYELGERARLAPDRVSLKDFSTRRPSLDLSVSVPGPGAATAEYYDYPGRYELPSEGDRLATIIAQAMRCDAQRFFGKTNSARLAPGHRFELVDGPMLVPDGSYVVVALHHRWEREAPYQAEIELLPADVVFRSMRDTAPPLQANLLTGFVTGAAGEDIHCNDLGEVKVHFPWDREQEKNDDCSHWVPVMQDNTGSSMGIPRVGWEVAAQFIHGDPDRPAVLGRMYNGADPFPEPLPAGKTRTTLKSMTSAPPLGVGLGPGMGGMDTVAANEIFLEDATGSELIYIQAQKDLNAVVANNKTETVLNDETHQVDGDEVIDIGGDHELLVGNDRALTVKGDQFVTVDKNRRRKIGKGESADIGKSRVTSIGSSHRRRIGTTDNTATGSLKESVGAVDLEVSLKPNSTTAGKVESLTVGGALVELALRNKDETVKSARIETVGGLLMSATLGGLSIDAGVSRTTNVGGMMMACSPKHVLYKSDALTSVHAMVALCTSPTKVGVKGGASTLVLEGGKLTLDAPEVVIKGDKIELFDDEAQFNP